MRWSVPGALQGPRAVAAAAGSSRRSRAAEVARTDATGSGGVTRMMLVCRVSILP